MLLYKAMLLEESGDAAGCLSHLETNDKKLVDRLL